MTVSNDDSDACGENGTGLGCIRLPPDFSIDYYAKDVEWARSMTLSPNGTLFVGSRNAGKVYALPDRNNDNKADDVIVIDEGLDLPTGVVFRNGSLYVAEVPRVLRYDNIEARLENPPEPVVVSDSFQTLLTVLTPGNTSNSGLMGNCMYLSECRATFVIRKRRTSVMEQS